MTDRDDIDIILNAFQPISLKEMDGVKLLDRMDVKFVFPTQHLATYLENLAGDYRVLEINGLRQSHYETIYFDSKDFQLYRMHHNGRANRYKLRIRKYLDTGIAYYELKIKNAKKRTIKERLISDDAFTENISMKPFLKISADAVERLTDCQIALRVRYSRVTLVSKTSPERLTIDSELIFHSGEDNIEAPPICIAEVKQEKNGRSVFSTLMHQNHINPLRISKYCYGMILHHPEIKKNNFKPKLRQIARIVNQSTRKTLIHHAKN